MKKSSVKWQSAETSFRVWWAIAAAGLLVFTGQVLQPVLYPDIWWQVREGLGYLAGGYAAIPAPATFAVASPHLFHEYVGYEVVMALFHRCGGWWSVWLLQMLIPFGIPLCLTSLWITESPRAKPYWIAAIGLSILTIILATRFQARPEVLALVWQASACCLLLRAEKLGRFLLLGGLCLCSLLWSNTHSSFVLLFFICGLWAGEQLLRAFWGEDKSLGRCFFLCLAVFLPVFFACLHPEGWKRLFLPLAHQGNNWAIFLTDEMWSPAWIVVANLSVIHVLVVVLCVSRLRKKTPFWLLAMGTVSLWMCAQHLRHIGIWTLCMMLVFGLLLFAPAKDAEVRPAPRWSPFLALATTLILLIYSLKCLMAYPRWPVEPAVLGGDGIAWIQEQSVEKKTILSDMCAGSFASKPEYGNTLVLLDTGLARFDEATLRTYYYLNYIPEAFDMALDGLEVDYVLIYGRNPKLAAVINRRPDWQLVHYEKGQFVYARKGHQGLKEIEAPLIQQGDAAFFYGLYREVPGQSLRHLSKYADSLLSEASFPFVWDWLRHLPPATLAEFEKEMPSGTDPQIAHLLSYAKTGGAPADKVWGSQVWIPAFISLKENKPEKAWEIIKAHRAPSHASPIQEECRFRMGLGQTDFQRKLVWDSENKDWLQNSIRQMNTTIKAWKK